tara:strand:- start:24 stop:332 length:309 start_codon:yes stop_codon:yes gene_type:complete
MGNQLLDQYTYLHFASGIIAYFWNISFKKWLILHIVFEIIENSVLGMNIINKFIIMWPGGKPQPDSVENSIGDTIAGTLGWLSAYYLDRLGKKLGWYELHIE